MRFSRAKLLAASGTPKWKSLRKWMRLPGVTGAKVATSLVVTVGSSRRKIRGAVYPVSQECALVHRHL